MTWALSIAGKLTTVSPSLAQTKQVLFLKKEKFSESYFNFAGSHNYNKIAIVPLDKNALFGNFLSYLTKKFSKIKFANEYN